MNKKGFTLMELLGVIIILALLTTIAIVGVTKIVKNSKEQLSETQMESIRLAAEIWGADNLNKLPNNNECMYFTLGTLKNLTLLDENIYDIANNEKISNELKIKITTSSDKFNNLKYKYEVVESENQISGCKNWTPVCVRATKLHGEICEQTDDTYYCSGDEYITGSTITYGSLGTIGELNSGDAFDCDVNGDGTYDSETERFYYISDLEDNLNYGVLIYYNNTTKGVPDNTSSSISYYHDDNVNNLGPESGKINLPDSNQWKNVSLSNNKRKIKNEKGNTTTNNGTLEIIEFDYAGYAARLLTTQEVEVACNISIGTYSVGELDSCNYLMENTKYSSNNVGTFGYWLETPRSSTSNNVWHIRGYYRHVPYGTLNETSYGGIRPVIEVPKTKIVY